MRRAVIVAVILAALFTGADVAARAVAERLAAAKVATALDLTGSPAVDIGGFPFLTQAARGRFGRITVTAEALRPRNALALTGATADLRDVAVPVRQVLAGEPARVHVGRLAATGTLPYDEMTRYLTLPRTSAVSDVRIGGSDAAAVLSLRVLGTRVSVPLRLSLVSGRLLVHMDDSALAALPAPAAAFVRGISGSYRIPQLPYGMQVDGVRTTARGLLVTASATGVDLTG